MAGPWEQFAPEDQQQGPWRQFGEKPEPTALEIAKRIGKHAFALNPIGASLKLQLGMGELGNKTGEAVTDIAAPHMSPEKAAALGYAANVGLQSVPVILGAIAGSNAVKPVIENVGRNIMQRAVKPTLADRQTGDAARAIDTMLKEGFNPTKGGVEAMQEQINLLKSQVDDAVKNSPAMINKSAVADRLRKVLDKFSNQVTPNGDLNAIQNAWTEFLQHPDLVGKPSMSAAKAQALKSGTYRILEGKYGEVGSASTEAQKALARGLKEELSASIPGIAAKNAREAELINARDIAYRSALMSGNKDMAGLALLANNPMAGLGFLADRSALIKSLLARGLYNSAGPLGVGIGAGIPAGLETVGGALYVPQQ